MFVGFTKQFIGFIKRNTETSPNHLTKQSFDQNSAKNLCKSHFINVLIGCCTCSSPDMRISGFIIRQFPSPVYMVIKKMLVPSASAAARACFQLCSLYLFQFPQKQHCRQQLHNNRVSL